MLAIDNFKEAAKNACLFGVSKEEMTEIIENTFKESPHN